VLKKTLVDFPNRLRRKAVGLPTAYHARSRVTQFTFALSFALVPRIMTVVRE